MTERRRSRAWVLFFAVLLLLAVVAVSVEVWFGLRQQLSPQALEQARTLWREKGPADYDLKYQVALQARGGERLEVRIQRATVVGVQANGERLDPILYPFHDLPGFLDWMGNWPPERPDGLEQSLTWVAPSQTKRLYEVRVRGGRVSSATVGGITLPAELAEHYDMPTLFAGIAHLLEQDTAASLRPYAVASFDPGDGHLLHYVRSRWQTRERVELSLMEFRNLSGASPVEKGREPPGQAPSPE